MEMRRFDDGGDHHKTVSGGGANSGDEDYPRMTILYCSISTN